MTNIEFMKELSDRGWLISPKLGISLCRNLNCSKECVLRQACDNLFEDEPPEATTEEFEKFLEKYPELKVVL